MKDDFKRNKITISTNGQNVEVLKYQLNNAKKDNKKNILITALVTGIVAFAAGHMFCTFSQVEVSGLQKTNAELRMENASLKAQATPEEK